MATINTPSVVGLTRSEQQARGLDTVNQGLQVLGQLREQQRQFNVVEGMKNVLNGADIATVLMTDEGRAALAPFVGDLTGLTGDRLSAYMESLAASPRTAEALYQQVQSGELMGLVGLQGGAPGTKPAPTPAVPAQEASFSSSPAPVAATPPDARTPAPAPTGGISLNKDEISALSQLAQLGVKGRGLGMQDIPYDPATGIRGTDFVSDLLPGQVFATPDEAKAAVERQMYSILQSGTPEARALWDQIQASAARMGMASAEGTREVMGRRRPDQQQYGPPTGRTYDQAFQAPAAAGQTAAPQSFRQFVQAKQAAGLLGGERVADQGDDATLQAANPGTFAEYQAFVRGTKPAWLGTTAAPAQTAAPAVAAGTRTGGAAGTTTAMDSEIVQKYVAESSSSGAQTGTPLTPTERTAAKRMVAKEEERVVADTRRQWRATPGLRGAAAGSGERIAAILERVAPGVRAEEHPILAETRVNWADLTKRKTEAEIEQALAAAGLNRVEAKYYLDKLSAEAASRAMEALATSSESYAKVLEAARGLITGLYSKDFEEIAKITDPVKRSAAEAALFERPGMKALWMATVDGLGFLSGRAVTAETYDTLRRGMFGNLTATGPAAAIPTLGGAVGAGQVGGIRAGAGPVQEASATGSKEAAAEAAGYSYP